MLILYILGTTLSLFGITTLGFLCLLLACQANFYSLAFTCLYIYSVSIIKKDYSCPLCRQQQALKLTGVIFQVLYIPQFLDVLGFSPLSLNKISLSKVYIFLCKMLSYKSDFVTGRPKAFLDFCLSVVIYSAYNIIYYCS